MIKPRKRVTTVAVIFGTLGASGAAQAAFGGPHYYAGVFAGDISGSGSSHDIGATYNVPTASGTTWGLLGGVTFRNGLWSLGAELDYGLGSTRTASTNQPVVNELQSNLHLLGRFGYQVNKFDLFATAGFAQLKTKGNIYSTSPTNTVTANGYSIGVGADYTAMQNIVVRLQVLQDEYNSKEYGNGYGIKDWSDTSIRAAAIFQF